MAALFSASANSYASMRLRSQFHRFILRKVILTDFSLFHIACSYNVTEEIAVRMSLDTLKTSSLWVDQVVIEVNIAILHSFQVGRLGRNVDSSNSLIYARSLSYTHSLTHSLTLFSDASSHLYNRVCPSVRPSVGPSVRP